MQIEITSYLVAVRTLVTVTYRFSAVTLELVVVTMPEIVPLTAEGPGAAFRKSIACTTASNNMLRVISKKTEK